MKANEIKKGAVIEVEGQKVVVKLVTVVSPSSRSGSTLYKVKGQNVVTRQKFERSFKGDEIVGEVDFVRNPVQLLFRDSDGCTFMDSESYEQFVVPEASLEEELLYITDGLEGLTALLADGELLSINLPTTVALEIVECSPGIKGGSASARTKPATLSTGLVVQVPEYLSPGEVIKVNTETGDYISRA
jgi:elongation factor P